MSRLASPIDKPVGGWNHAPAAIRKVEPMLHSGAQPNPTLSQINDASPAEIVFFDELAPCHLHDVWDLESVKAVIWTNGKGRSGPKKSDTPWATVSFRIDHSLLGGMTEIRTWITIAERKADHSEATPMASTMLVQEARGVVGTTVKSILDPTIPGPTCAPPDNDKDDVQWRKLAPRELWERHRLPSVFSLSKFVRQKLSNKEVASALDFPLAIIKARDDGQILAAWLQSSLVPFKI
ncbi:hypothetical protein ACA910_012050 [Epithemia clementina (nom. ined.)]